MANQKKENWGRRRRRRRRRRRFHKAPADRMTGAEWTERKTPCPSSRKLGKTQ